MVTRRSILRALAATGALAAAGPLIRGGRGPGVPIGARRIRFGVQTWQQHTDYKAVRDTWLEAEELGLDTAFVFDHFLPVFSKDIDGPCHEGWTLLSSLCAETERIEAGILVSGNTYRAPALLAKMAATVEEISRGRLILGMGAGWFEREHSAYGIPFYTPGERARRLTESVEIVKKLFTQNRTTYDGRYYDIVDAPFQPRSVGRTHPPILIGGMGPKVVQPLAAKHADIWHFFVPSGEAAEAQRINQHFDDLCRKVGREPRAVERAMFVPWEKQTTREMRHQIEGLVGAGVDHFVLSMKAPFDRARLRAFATEVAPTFRS